MPDLTLFGTDLTLFGIVAAVFFFAAFVKGTTGLGFSTTCLPFLVLTVGLEKTLPMLLIPSIASNIIVMRDAGRFRESASRFWPLVLAAVPGVVIGLSLLVWIDKAIAAAVLGVVLILYCVWAYAKPGATLPSRLEKPLGPLVGFSTGVINGLTGSQVMPVLPFMVSLRLPSDLFVQAINMSFTFSSFVMMAGLSRIGFLTVEVAVISALGLIPVWVGVRLGNQVRKRLSAETFRTLVLLLLGVLGATLAARAVPIVFQ